MSEFLIDVFVGFVSLMLFAVLCLTVSEFMRYFGVTVDMFFTLFILLISSIVCGKIVRALFK